MRGGGKGKRRRKRKKGEEERREEKRAGEIQEARVESKGGRKVERVSQEKAIVLNYFKLEPLHHRRVVVYNAVTYRGGYNLVSRVAARSSNCKTPWMVWS